MTEDIFSKLDNVFETHEARKNAAAAAEAERVAAIEARLVVFNEARNSIFRPAMEELGEYLKTKGHAYRIETDENAQQHGQTRRQDPFIQFVVIPKGYPMYQSSNSQLPHFSIRSSGISDDVYFSRSTLLGQGGGVSGGDGRAKLIDVTADVVKQRIVKLITEVFSR